MEDEERTYWKASRHCFLILGVFHFWTVEVGESREASTTNKGISGDRHKTLPAPTIILTQQ
jgi:hypothetical protein